MDEARRRDYLAAMGVRLWSLRQPLERPLLADPVLADAADMLAARVEEHESSEPHPIEPNPSQLAERADSSVEERLIEAPQAASARASDPAVMDWDELEAAVAVCRACGLCETRTNTVFGVGNRQASLMVIGEAPGADEDRAGEPFVGRAGQLLNRMLASIGYPRELVYIANVLKCRPPGNRDPRPEESRQCQGFLARQVQLIQPRLILAVGRIAAQHLLETEESVGRLRGRWLAFGPRQTPVRVTYHPAYLLRSPEQKAKVWDDLTLVRRRLDETSSQA